MPSALTVSEYILPPPTVSIRGALNDNQRSRSGQLGRLAMLAASVARGRAALKDQNDRFDELYREAERTEATPEEVEDAARVVFENERKVAAALLPQIEQLQRNLSRRHLSTDFARAARRAAEEALDIGQTWLDLYQNLRIGLLKLASDRRMAAGETGSPILSDADEMEAYLRRAAGG